MSCKARQRIVCVARDGSQKEIHRCANMACSRFMSEVAGECDTCTEAVLPEPLKPLPVLPEPPPPKARMMDDGTVVVEKIGWEPPAVPKGYRRKSKDLRSDDAWVLLPEYPECPKRRLILDQARCGKVDVKAICRDGPKMVNLETCRKCLAGE